jgi:hypothetical protein
MATWRSADTPTPSFDGVASGYRGDVEKGRPAAACPVDQRCRAAQQNRAGFSAQGRIGQSGRETGTALEAGR